MNSILNNSLNIIEKAVSESNDYKLLKPYLKVRSFNIYTNTKKEYFYANVLHRQKSKRMPKSKPIDKPHIPALERVRSEERISTNEDVALIKSGIDFAIKRVKIDVISRKSPRSC